MTVYIDKEISKERYKTIRDLLKDGNIMDKFKAIICPRCKHNDDKQFKECKICRCIDGTIKCCEFSASPKIDPTKGIEEEKLDKLISSIANKNRELASFQNK